MDSEKTAPLNGSGDVQIAQESNAHVAVTGASYFHHVKSRPCSSFILPTHLCRSKASPVQQRTDSATDPSGPTPPVRTSSIQSVPVLDDSSSMTVTSKPPPSASTVGTEVPPTALNTNTSSSQKRNSLLAAPARTSSTENAAEQSPTSTSSTAVTATRDVDVTSTTSRKRRRRREGGSNGSSVTGEEGRSHKQGGIGRFFGFLCCRGSSPEVKENDGSRLAKQRPGSASPRISTPVKKIIAKDISVSHSRDAVDNEKIVEDSGESKLKSDSSSVPPVILNSKSVVKDDEIADHEGLGVSKDGSAAEETGANRLPLLDTPIVTVQAPTPTPVSEPDDNSSRPGSASLPEPPADLVIKKEEDVDMEEARADDASDGGSANISPNIAEEAGRGGDSDSDDGSDAGPGIYPGPGVLVETPPVDDKQQWLLPPIAPRFEGKKCLVLDLDETLVHSSFKVFSLVYLIFALLLTSETRYYIKPILPSRWRSKATTTMSTSSRDLGLTSS